MSSERASGTELSVALLALVLSVGMGSAVVGQHVSSCGETAATTLEGAGMTRCLHIVAPHVAPQSVLRFEDLRTHIAHKFLREIGMGSRHVLP